LRRIEGREEEDKRKDNRRKKRDNKIVNTKERERVEGEIRK
jgi:hypothetical protein